MDREGNDRVDTNWETVRAQSSGRANGARHIRLVGSLAAVPTETQLVTNTSCRSRGAYVDPTLGTGEPSRQIEAIGTAKSQPTFNQVIPLRFQLDAALNEKRRHWTLRARD